MSDLISARARLENEWHLLKDQWQATSAQWNDVVRHRFERDFMQEYEPVIRSALKGMDRLAAVIAQAQREVK